MLSRTLRFAVRIKMSSHRRMCNDEDIISVIKPDTLANKRSAFPLWTSAYEVNAVEVLTL